MPQCSRPCLGIWGAVSNNTATILRLSIEENMSSVCWRGLYCYARRGTESEKRCLSAPQRDGVSRLRHESFGSSLQLVSNCETECTMCTACRLVFGASVNVLVTWIHFHVLGAKKASLYYLWLSIHEWIHFILLEQCSKSNPKNLLPGVIVGIQTASVGDQFVSPTLALFWNIYIQLILCLPVLG